MWYTAEGTAFLLALCVSDSVCPLSDLVSASLSLCLSQCQLVLEDWSPLPSQSHRGACTPPKQMACAAFSLPSVQSLRHIWKTYIWISFILIQAVQDLVTCQPKQSYFEDVFLLHSTSQFTLENYRISITSFYLYSMFSHPSLKKWNIFNYVMPRCSISHMKLMWASYFHSSYPSLLSQQQISL